MPNSTPFETVIDQIRDLRKEADEQFADKPAIKQRVNAELTKLERYLCNLGRVKFETPERRHFGPIEIEEKPSPILPDKSPKQLEAEVLIKLINEVEPTFLERESAEILDSVEDLVIRGIAIRANMDGITETSPEKIDVEFIDSIKERILLNQQLEAVDAKASEEQKDEIQDFRESQLEEFEEETGPEDFFDLEDENPKEPASEEVKDYAHSSEEVKDEIQEFRDSQLDEFESLDELPHEDNPEVKEDKPKKGGKKKKNDPAEDQQ